MKRLEFVDRESMIFINGPVTDLLFDPSRYMTCVARYYVSMSGCEDGL